MKINALKEVYAQPGVQLMDCTWIDVPLQTIIERELFSNYTLDLPGLPWRSIHASDNQEKSLNPAPICFQEQGAKHRLENGVVFFTSLFELVEFISHKIDHDGEGPLSEVAKIAASARGELDKSIVEEMIEEAHRMRRPTLLSRTQIRLPITRVAREEKLDLTPVSSAGQQFWAWNLNRFMCINVIMAFERLMEIGGYKLPRFVMIKTLSDGDTDARFDHRKMLVFDGQKHLWNMRLDDLPRELIAEMDQKGKMYYLCNFDILPLDHLECRAVVRIPPKEEVIRLISGIGDCIRESKAPHDLLQAPALAFDSHFPLRIPQGIKVIDAPEAVVWFLSRTVKGIFIPGQPGSMFPVKNIPEHESFQLLTKPRRLH